jgi:putative cardiolipin synthase
MLANSRVHPVIRVFLMIALLWFSIVPLQGQDVYRLLNGEREALQCRVDLMTQAKEEILLSTFIIEGDLIGLTTLELLEDAVKRGVKVKLILDDMGNRLPSDLLSYLDQKGIEVRVFNIKNLTKLRSLVDRMHDKMLVTDRKNLIVGGRNLKEEYFSLDSVVNFLDREVYIHSDSAVAHATEHFHTLWNHPGLTAKKRRVDMSRKDRRQWDHQMTNAPETVQVRLNLRLPSNRNWAAGVQSTQNPVYFEHDQFLVKKGKKTKLRRRKDKNVTRVLIGLVDSAKVSIDIENAYFMPTNRWWRAIKRAKKRGVKVRVLTNSAYTSDVPLVQSVYAYKRGKYCRAGLELWEYNGPKMLHTKAMTIDGQVAVNGSYNLDTKSENYNTEVIAYVRDPRVAAEQQRYMEATYRKSLCVSDPQLSTAWAGQLGPPTELQKKRRNKVRIFRWTLAPLADVFF